MAKNLRIISLVPSWTETLIEAGLTPVGRTRFCIFPEARVKAIPSVGGTKQADWEKIAELKPDLLIFDKEENPKSFAESAPCEYWASHIEGLKDVPKELERLALRLENGALGEMAEEWDKVEREPKDFEVSHPPALIEWVKKPSVEIKKVVYLIWKKPWMSVSKHTFIGSMLSHLGAEAYLADYDTKYPELELSDFDQENCLVLLSTEPYPFEKGRAEFAKFECASALVDGSKMSWFGVRSLRYLQSL